MPHVIAVSVIVLSTLLVASCGGERSTALTFSDGENPVQRPGNGTGNPQYEAQTPEYKGDLEFSSTRTVDLSALLDGSELHSAHAAIMAHDGLTVLVRMQDEKGHAQAFIIIDTNTGEANWLFREISDDTRIVFDANNRPVAALAIRCGSVSYRAEQDITLFDMTNVIPAQRCLSSEQQVSADGNVVLLGSYDAESTNSSSNEITQFHAYSINTASLIDYPDTRLSIDGVTLSARWPDSLFTDSYFSDDGQWLLTRQWWEGIDRSGGTRRQVGSVLWDTSSGQWQTRGLMADQRHCIATQKLSCKPPYRYVMSSDGMTQYVQTPTSERINPGSGPVVEFATTTFKTGSSQVGVSRVVGLDNVASLTVDSSGEQLAFFVQDDTERVQEGYRLFDGSSGQSVSLNRSLSLCPSSAENDNKQDDTSCVHQTVPRSIASNAISFSADGSRLLLKAIARLTDSQQRLLHDFLLDIDDGNVYTIPAPFSAEPQGMSGDGSVMLGISGFPDYDFVIGRR